MALPQDGQNANALATVKEVPIGKKLIFVDPDTNEGGIITLEDLTTQILKKLTSQTFALDQGTKTLPAALNELNSNRLTDSTKLLETPTEYIENISDSDYASCFRNGKIVTLVLNIKVLRPLSSFNTYLTLPKQYIPSSVMLAPVMALNTGIRIGTSGEVMPCADIDAGAYIQTTISYVIK